jgi:hypothetical protein
VTLEDTVHLLEVALHKNEAIRTEPSQPFKEIKEAKKKSMN